MKHLKNIKILFIMVVMIFTTNIFGQTKIDNEEKPYIEVTGFAEQEVIPDEIFINIILREKYINKEKMTIENLEGKLKQYLKEIGVDNSNLYLSDANADYVKVKWWSTDVITKKDYTLKVSNATMVGQVFMQLEKLEITDAYILKVNHSKQDSLNKEVRISAIKSAKSQADYLLAAIGENTGNPLIIKEQERITPSSGINFRENRSSGIVYYVDGVKKRENNENNEEIQFKKIKIVSYIYVKFSKR